MRVTIQMLDRLIGSKRIPNATKEELRKQRKILKSRLRSLEKVHGKSGRSH
jgi:hypothetical protein